MTLESAIFTPQYFKFPKSCDKIVTLLHNNQNYILALSLLSIKIELFHHNVKGQAGKHQKIITIIKH